MGNMFPAFTTMHNIEGAGILTFTCLYVHICTAGVNLDLTPCIVAKASATFIEWYVEDAV